MKLFLVGNYGIHGRFSESQTREYWKKNQTPLLTISVAFDYRQSARFSITLLPYSKKWLNFASSFLRTDPDNLLVCTIRLTWSLDLSINLKNCQTIMSFIQYMYDIIINNWLFYFWKNSAIIYNYYVGINSFVLHY